MKYRHLLRRNHRVADRVGLDRHAATPCHRALVAQHLVDRAEAVSDGVGAQPRQPGGVA